MMMSNQHRDRPLSVRPPNEYRVSAQDELEKRDRDLTGFITACLVAMSKEPDKMLAFLAGHWPEPKPRGRPPRQDKGGSV